MYVICWKVRLWMNSPGWSSLNSGLGLGLMHLMKCSSVFSPVAGTYTGDLPVAGTSTSVGALILIRGSASSSMRSIIWMLNLAQIVL
jgi:hypothetical protein